MVRTLQCYTLACSVLSLYKGGAGGGNLCMKRLWMIVVLLSGVNHNDHIFFPLPSVMCMYI